MAGSSFDMYLYQFISLGPTLIVLVVGVVLALRNLQRHPRPCWALLAALALMAANLVSSFLLPTILQFLGGIDSGILMLMYMLSQSILNAASWGLVMFAIFDRPLPPRFLIEEDPDRDILDHPRRSS